MLTFLGVAFLIYAGMNFDELNKEWHAFPHSIGLGRMLMLAGARDDPVTPTILATDPAKIGLA